MLSDRCLEALKTAKAMIAAAVAENRYYENEPGKEALKICPDIIRELSPGVDSIVISGTNGKTTANRFLSSIFTEAGIAHFANKEGANLSWRVATLYARNYELESGPVLNMALLECDEGNMPKVLPEVGPKAVIITNIYPDQLGRYVSEEHVADLIVSALRETEPSICFISRDCHFLEKFKALEGWKIIEYAPEDGKIVLGGNGYDVAMPTSGYHNLWNAQAAAVCAEYFGIGTEVILRGIEKAQPAFGRFEKIQTDHNCVTICLAKNPAGFEATTKCINGEFDKAGKTLIIAMNRNPGDDSDTDWLDDNPYESLACGFDRVLITGNCTEELTVLLERHQIPASVLNPADVFECIGNTNGDIVIVANYTAMMNIRQGFTDRGLVKEYWY